MYAILHLSPYLSRFLTDSGDWKLIHQTYGITNSGRFARAQRAFIRSLAGYSVVTYLLQIKDRHNGNILVDRDGHLIHIDFGFMLSNSPGGNMGFEAAPFKFPLDYVEVLGGLESQGWKEFKRLFKEGFEAARKHSDSLISTSCCWQLDLLPSIDQDGIATRPWLV